MRVFVAGGAGYVGCALVRALLARGHTVRVFDRLFFGSAGLDGLDGPLEVRVGDVRRVSAADLEGMDAVVNLAGISSDPTAGFRPALTHEMNVVGAVRLACACRAAGIRRYLFASSCSVYDSGVASEAADVLLDETSAVTPFSAYAKSKLEAEQELLALADRSFVPVSLRKGTVYGPSSRMRYDLVVNALFKDAVTRGVMTLRAGGETWRPVVEVADAARAYLACLEADERLVAGQIFNVVYRNLRVSEMALRVRHALTELGIHTDVRPDYGCPPARSYRVSGAKLARVLGVEPSVSVEEAVRQAGRLVTKHPRLDLEHASHYNIRWFEWLEQEHRRARAAGSPFDR